MIGTKQRTLQILEQYNLHAKKAFGQNFLIDSNIINKIVDSADVLSSGVIEIGPGLGAMTEVLTQKAKKVLAYEIDNDMVEILQNNIKADNFKILNVDFLKADLNKDLEFFDDCDRVVVVSNLPYYITTPIIFKLLASETRITEFYFMVQKEVAQRFTGKPNTKDYNSLSVLIQYRTNAKILFNVPRTCFHPAPDVESAIIKLVKVKRDYDIANEEKFISFVQNLFALRRKTIVNNLSSKYSFSKEQISNVLIEEGFSDKARAEELDLSEIVKLYKAFFECWYHHLTN